MATTLPSDQQPSPIFVPIPNASMKPYDSALLQDTVSVKPKEVQVLRLYSHSSFVYWWPVWLLGYAMALTTYFFGQSQQIEAIGQAREWIHSSSNLGVIFILELYFIILLTNFSVRGYASGIVILSIALVSVLLAYFGWWDNVFRWFGNLTIHITLGGYFWFSTLIFITWILTVFILDRLSYWEVTPGQLTHKSLYGSGSQSYNTQGMALEKHRDDLFRHWLVGLGSGDLRIRTSGATREQIDVSNVLLIGSKIVTMQRLIAQVPEGRESA